VTTGKAGFKGYAPSVKIEGHKPTQEELKYKKMWSIDDYRKVSPGELAANTFLHVACPDPGDDVIDLGCGTGRGGLMLQFLGNMHVTFMDFAENCLDEEIAESCQKNGKMRFIKKDLNAIPRIHTKYGYCVDVLEHIPPDELDNVISHCLEYGQNVFFGISTVDDVMGERIGEKLHLSVHDYAWWCNKFVGMDCQILYSERLSNAVYFYVTAWTEGIPWAKNLNINTDVETVKKHIIENAKLDIQPATPHKRQEREIMLLGGGPSLLDFQEEIIQNRKDGMALATTNGAYNWCISQDLKPSCQLIIDAKETNIRFLPKVVEDCVYFLASQCHPSLFDKVPHDKTYMWQVSLNEELMPIIAEHP